MTRPAGQSIASTSGRDFRLTMLEATLSSLDRMRRSLGGGEAPMSVVYLEAARGCLHHAREALLNYMRHEGEAWSSMMSGGATLVGTSGQRLCTLKAPAGWEDERQPATADLGSDLFGSAEIRDDAGRRMFGAMLACALADHAWLHTATGASWATDRSGAVALVGALSGGRPVDVIAVETLSGALEETLVRRIADLGWRRLRSPSLTA